MNKLNKMLDKFALLVWVVIIPLFCIWYNHDTTVMQHPEWTLVNFVFLYVLMYIAIVISVGLLLLPIGMD